MAASFGLEVQPGGPTDVTTDPAADALKQKKPTAAIGLAPGGQATGQAALQTEYPDAPSTTGQPQNRLKLAQTAFDTFAKSTAPQYTADIRQATQAAAGKGQIGSGGLRTTYGNLANQRSLALDTQRDNLITEATKGTIADQQAADANKLGLYNAETSRLGTTGNLDVAKGTLGLAKEHEATASGQTQQQIDLQKSRDAIDAQVRAGTLTIAQAQQKLAELTAGQQYGLETEKLGLAKEGAATQKEQFAAGLAETAAGREATTAAEAARLGLAKESLTASTAADQQRIQIAKDQLAQTGAQFGLSLAQQKDLATLADKTANRQLDISSAQGQNTLLLELARIMGDKANTAPPEFLAQIAKALGAAVPTGTVGTTGEVPKVTPTVGLAREDGTGGNDEAKYKRSEV